MLVKKQFKGQVHTFDLPTEQAMKLVKTDRRYTLIEQETIEESVEYTEPKQRRGRKVNGE
jgi:hypothetical protein